jgi:hypothetical protein
MRFAGPLELGQVPAVELDVTRRRKRLFDMSREGDRYQPVLSSPDEQRLGREAP